MAARGPDDLPLFREKRINDPVRALKELAAVIDEPPAQESRGRQKGRKRRSEDDYEEEE